MIVIFEDVLSIVFGFAAMCFVIYLSYVASRYLAKNTTVRMSGSKYFRVHDSLGLGKDRFLAVVEIGKRTFLVAVTDQKIELLAEMDEATLQPIEVEGQNLPKFGAESFDALLKKVMKKK